MVANSDDILKTNTSEIMNKHGLRSSFLKIIYRFRVMGWLFFIILFIYLLAHHAIYTIVPKPVLVVNEEGQIIGQVDYYSDLNRTKKQFYHTGKSFLQYRLSYNSATIFDDLELMLNMMSPSLHKKEENIIANDPKYFKIYEAGVSSKIIWDKVNYVELKPTSAIIEYTGSVKITGKSSKSFDFKMRVKLASVVRSDKQTFGIEVINYEDI